MVQTELEKTVAEFAPNYYVGIRNPRWANQQHTQIMCEVNFKHIRHEEWSGFCADPEDYMPYSKEIFERCASGEFGEVKEFILIADSSTSLWLPPSEQDMRATQMPRIIL